MKSSVVDKSVWDGLREFEKSEGSEGFFTELLGTVLTASKTQMEGLLAASSAGDFAKTRSYSHSLKSTCASLGAHGLSAQFAEIEAGCRATPPTMDPPKVTAANQVFQIFYQEVQEEYDRLTKSAA